MFDKQSDQLHRHIFMDTDCRHTDTAPSHQFFDIELEIGSVLFLIAFLEPKPQK